MGIAILGSLLASLVVSRARYLHQWSLAERKQEAIGEADVLLGNWWLDPNTIPRNGAGKIPSHKMGWRTLIVDNTSVTDLDVQTVRLEIFDERGSEATPLASSNVQFSTPLVRVDVLLNKPTSASDADPGPAGKAPQP